MSLLVERFLYKEPSPLIGRMQSGLATLIVTPSPNKTDGNGDRAVDDEPFINKRKPLSTTAVIGVLSNGFISLSVFLSVSKGYESMVKEC